jgi:DNA repair exonuclease SbcCD ATPase subunit
VRDKSQIDYLAERNAQICREHKALSDLCHQITQSLAASEAKVTHLLDNRVSQEELDAELELALDLQKKLDDANRDLTAANAEIARLTIEIDTESKAREKAEANLRCAIQQIHVLEEELAEETEARERAERLLNNEQRELREAEKNYTLMAKDFLAQRNELDYTKIRRSDAEKRCADLEDQVADLTAKRSRVTVNKTGQVVARDTMGRFAPFQLVPKPCPLCSKECNLMTEASYKKHLLSCFSDKTREGYKPANREPSHGEEVRQWRDCPMCPDSMLSTLEKFNEHVNQCIDK